MTSTTHPDREIGAPGRLLYLTEPLRAAIDFGLLTSSAPLLALLPRGDGHPAVIWAVSDRLAQSAGQWHPFKPPPLLAPAYPHPERRP